MLKSEAHILISPSSLSDAARPLIHIGVGVSHSFTVNNCGAIVSFPHLSSAIQWIKCIPSGKSSVNSFPTSSISKLPSPSFPISILNLYAMSRESVQSSLAVTKAETIPPHVFPAVHFSISESKSTNCGATLFSSVIYCLSSHIPARVSLSYVHQSITFHVLSITTHPEVGSSNIKSVIDGATLEHPSSSISIGTPVSAGSGATSTQATMAVSRGQIILASVNGVISTILIRCVSIIKDIGSFSIFSGSLKENILKRSPVLQSVLLSTKVTVISTFSGQLSIYIPS